MNKQSVKNLTKRIAVAFLVMFLLGSSMYCGVKADELSGSTDTALSGKTITMGETVFDSITEDIDYNYYKFTLDQAGRIALTFTSYMQYYQVILYNEAGEQIWYTDNNEYNSTVKFRTDSYDLDLTSGNYFMRVAGYRLGDRYKSTGTYNFSTKFVSAGESFSEHHDTALTSNNLTMGKKLNGQIAINDDYDYYTFNVTSACKLKINITSYMEYYQIILYDADGKQIWYTDNNEYNEQVGYRKDTHVIDLSPQTYYMSIAGYRYGTSYKSTGNYTFTASLVSLPKKVKLSSTSLKFYGYGQTKKLKASLVPSGSLSNLTWTSSDSSVVSVDQNGVITTRNYGTAKITVATENNCTATCKVTVKKVPTPKKLTVKKSGSRAAKITWSKVSGASGYYLYRSSGSRDYGYSMVKKLGKNTVSYTDKGLSKGTTYYYKIVAYKNINGCAIVSNETSAKSVRIK